MYNPQDSNLKKFMKSPQHLWLLALTVGIGFLSAHPLIFLVGLALYAVGWIHLPDSQMFKDWVKKNDDRIAGEQSQQQVKAFLERRQSLIASLAPDRLRRYMDVGRICLDIEKATRESAAPSDAEADPRLRKLDELMWTFLRLLVMEGSLESFLDNESGETISGEITTAKAEIAALEDEIKAETAKGENPAGRVRLLDSKKERFTVLTKRLDRVHDAKENADLVTAEQDRLVEQIKLLRADAIAARNADTLTARIDATVEHLTETNKLFSEMDQFKDLVADDMPQSGERLGFTAASAPPVITSPPPPPLPRDRRIGQIGRN